MTWWDEKVNDLVTTWWDESREGEGPKPWAWQVGYCPGPHDSMSCTGIQRYCMSHAEFINH